MRTLAKNKQPIYLCQQYEENGMVLYKDPVLLKVSINTISNKWSIANMGPVTKDSKNIICDEEDALLFTNGDKVYLYNQPEYNDKLASNADYIVVSTPTSLNIKSIVIKKLTG